MTHRSLTTEIPQINRSCPSTSWEEYLRYKRNMTGTQEHLFEVDVASVLSIGFLEIVGETRKDHGHTG